MLPGFLSPPTQQEALKKKTDQLCKSRNLTEETLKIWCFSGPKGGGRGAPLVTGPVFIPWRLRRRSRNKADGINCKYHWRRNTVGLSVRVILRLSAGLGGVYWPLHRLLGDAFRNVRLPPTVKVCQPVRQARQHSRRYGAQSRTDVIGPSLSVQRRRSGQMVEGSERSIAVYS